MLAYLGSAVALLFLYTICYNAYRIVFNLYFHPLRDFPGPLPARASEWWKVYIEVIREDSLPLVLSQLHKTYGNIVRISPNELHFGTPKAYNEIYNSSARWDKEAVLYRSFGEDHTTFGFLTVKEAKKRRDILQPLFSRRAILAMQETVAEKITALCRSLSLHNEQNQSSDMLLAFRSYALDNITSFCFGESINAIAAPAFSHPIVIAMDAALPSTPTFKHFEYVRKTILGMPPWLGAKLSPKTSGLAELKELVKSHVDDVVANPSVLENAPHPTIYHRLLDTSVTKGYEVPDRASLYEEAQMFSFAGGMTVGDALTIGLFHILSQPELYVRLKAEVLSVWPDVNSVPRYEKLESLPLLTATLKELLRFSHGVTHPLLRVTPSTGATIADSWIPGGTVVGCSSIFVHRSEDIFPDPDLFRPERWQGTDHKQLDQWLVSFSRGPRSCLGINLAWCELYLGLASLMRRFELTLDGTTAKDMEWRDCFTLYFPRRHLHVWCKPTAV